MSEILPLLLGGLVLFLYAIARLSSVLRDVFDERAKRMIERSTDRLVLSVLIGTVLTILLGSSSAVIILTIVFINAGTLRFAQAVGIVLGANIGTTFSSQVISLDIGQYAVIPMILGLAIDVLARSDRWTRRGDILLYFGMLFFGLFAMEQSVAPLRDSPAFLEWMSRIGDSAVLGAAVGGLVTLVIQSSSGTVGMAIVLGKQNILSLAGGVAVMLGAEIGTCSDTLLATIKGNRQALKTGLFHLVFNGTTIALGLALFQPFVELVDWISGEAPLGRRIANAHVLFNVLGVVLMLPLVRPAVQLFDRVLPDRGQRCRSR